MILTLVRVLWLIAIVTAGLTAAYPTVTNAQEASPLAPLDTSSPRATYESFWGEARQLEKLYASYRSNKTAKGAADILRSFAKLQRLFDLSELPRATRNESGGTAVVQLYDVFLRLPRVPGDMIPDETSSDPVGKWRVPESEIIIQRITEGEDEGEYLFSSGTVDRIGEFHAAIIDRPPLHDTRYPSWREEQVRYTGPVFHYGYLAALPPTLQTPVLGTPIWKFGLIILLYAACFSVVAVWMIVARRIARGSTPLKVLLLRLSVPLLLWALVSTLAPFVRSQINPSGSFAEATHILASVAIYFSIAWAAWITCYLVVAAIIATPMLPDDSYDAHLLRLLARVISLLIAGAILIYGANDVGIPALGLLAGVGVGGFALALAAQSTVENLFGGVSIFADRPFRVGDYIRYGSDTGVVEAIGPRSSRLRGLDNTLTTVPNADLAKMHVTNFSKRTKILFRHQIGLRYETSAAQIKWFSMELLDRLSSHPKIEQMSGLPRVRLIGFGSSSIDLEVRAYVMTSDYGEFLMIQDELMVDVMECIDAAGTGFAFPSQTAYIARDSGLDEAVKARIERQVGRAASIQEPGAERTDLPQDDILDEDSVDEDAGEASVR